ncbi:MAG: PilN domain-containing protein [Gammaproteobacteria bacterium]
MITGINLLPWREERKKNKNIVFGILASSVVSLVFVFMSFLKSNLQSDLDQIFQDNEKLRMKILAKTSLLGAVGNIEKDRAEIEKRLLVIKEVELSRGMNVKMLLMFSQNVPSGIKIKSIKKEANKITVIGITKQNLDVSEFMDNIKKNNFIKEVKLTRIVDNTQKNQGSSVGSKGFDYEFEIIISAVEEGNG